MKQGDVAASKSAYEESLRLHEEAGQKSATTFPLCGLGELLLYSGDLTGARQRFEKSEAIAHETDEKPLLPAALSGMGEVFLQQGQFSDARQVYEQALKIDKDFGYKAEAAEMLLGLAQVKVAEGHPAEAESSILEALKEFRAGRLRDDEIHMLVSRVVSMGNCFGYPSFPASRPLPERRSKCTKISRTFSALSSNRQPVLRES
jgi:tetratricopeptide (TPR) repeat protein